MTGAGVGPVRVDLNDASQAELKGLPGTGPAQAQRIVARRRSAPFRSVDERIEVSGIGPKELQEQRPLMEVCQP